LVVELKQVLEKSHVVLQAPVKTNFLCRHKLSSEVYKAVKLSFDVFELAEVFLALRKQVCKLNPAFDFLWTYKVKLLNNLHVLPQTTDPFVIQIEYTLHSL
jgi:hypothetical protein